MQNEVIGLMNKDILELQEGSKRLNSNMQQVLNILNGVTERVLKIEAAQAELETAVLKIAERVKEYSVDSKRDGKEL